MKHLTYHQKLAKLKRRDLRICDIYQNTKIPACTIYRRYKITNGRLYQILDKHGIKPRTP